MLILARQLNQCVQIGPHVKIQIISLGDGVVRLGIDAPPDWEIVRDDVKTPKKSKGRKLPPAPAAPPRASWGRRKTT